VIILLRVDIQYLFNSKVVSLDFQKRLVMPSRNSGEASQGFDSDQSDLPTLTSKSYLCANLHGDDATGSQRLK
jgi:hypothetical protein